MYCSKDVHKTFKFLLATESASPFSTLESESAVELQLQLQVTMADYVVLQCFPRLQQYSQLRGSDGYYFLSKIWQW